MKFTGQFRDRDNNLIQVDILNGDQTKVVEIGGNNTAGSVRKWYVRHIKKNLSQIKEK